MQIHGIGTPNIGLPTTPSAGAGTESGGFVEMFEQMISNLNQTSQASTDAASGLALGKDTDLHKVVLASELESLSFSLALQVRNKVVDAYHEIMRMPI